MGRWAREGLRAGRSTGFVPTMGALHEGHLSLIRRARRENDRVAVSVFVNPAQFGPKEDFQRYPRPFRRDAALCRAAGVDALFVPPAGALYLPGHETWVEVEKLSRPLCGAFRPGHFRGVATVVLKLFQIVQPTRAYFGEKDFQQLRVIAKMVRDLNVPVRVVACPTVREPSGLALSSRNAFLGSAERQAAPLLQRALREGARAAASGRNPAAARRAALALLARMPGARVEYLAVVDPETLAPLSRGRAGGVVAAAVRVGKTRLIDNARVGAPRGGGRP